MMRQILARIILNGYLYPELKSFTGKLSRKIFSSIRNIFVRFSDAEVKFKFANNSIFLPLSHNLPFNKKIFPVYDENIGRLASLLQEKYDDLRMIDIGANIGDTVLMVKSKSDIPILCIEGENKFISYLHKNISKYKNVFVEESFVGDKKSIKGNYILSGGSGRIIEDDKQTEINFKSLEEILTKYPEFKTCKLLKIDTDGFDCRIIKNEIAFIASVKPVIFFEYDPFFYNKENSINVFDLLSEAGYSRAVFYENTGDYLLTTQLRDKELLADLHYYFSGRNMNRYCDIAVFPVEDDNLADKLRDIEIHYFSQIRNYKIN